MPIKRINEFPEGSGSLTNDDMFLFMDDPSASGVTKKISLAELSAAIGGGGSVPDGNFDVINLSTTADPEILQGSIGWDAAEGTVDIGLTDQVKIHVGEHNFFRIRNNTSGTIYAGQAVYAIGIHNNSLIESDLYAADGSVEEVRFLGIVLNDIEINQHGYAVNFGHVEELDTRGDGATNGASNLWDANEPAWVAGDILYVHPVAAGKLTKIKPDHAISVAIVMYVHQNNGRIFVRPTEYGHLGDNHDVDISNPTEGQILTYNSSTTKWENNDPTSNEPTFVKYEYSTTTGNIGGTNSILGINSDGGNFAFDESLGVGYDGGMASTISIDSTTGIISGFVENGIYRFDASFFYQRDSANSTFDRDFYLSMEYKSGSSSYRILDEYYGPLFQGSTLNNSLYYFTAKLNGVMKFVGSDPTQRVIRISQSPDITSDLYVDYGYFSITRIG